MNEDILQTKLFIPPVRPNVVPRHRLINQLTKKTDLGSKLSLISAPAGFGKTTLIADWLQQSGFKAAWLSLDEGDDDPIRFLSYLFTAMERSGICCADAARDILSSPHSPDPTQKLKVFINEFIERDDQEMSVIVLDDYHLIDNPAIHQVVDFLIENQPPQLHLVIISREDPPLSLSLLRGRGELSEMRLAELKFNNQESTIFLNDVFELDLEPAQIETLNARTEGWISGLQLAGLSMQGNPDRDGFVASFSGSNRYILDYLVEQVFEKQSQEMQRFLLCTSILDQVTAPLCDFLLSSEPGSSTRGDSQQILDQLERNNLFIIALDESRLWFRYHRLFGDLLQHRLRQEGIDIAELHHRAGTWLSKNGYARKAINHFLSAREWELAIDQMLEVGESLTKRGENETLIRWANLLPDENLKASPALCMQLVWALALNGRIDEAEEYLVVVESQRPDDQGLQMDLLTAQIHIARARHDHSRTIELSQAVLSRIPQSQNEIRSVLNLNLGLAYWQTGRLESARQSMENARAGAARSENHHAELLATGIIGTILASQGHLRESYTVLEEAVDKGGLYPASALARISFAMLLHEWNRLEEAEQQIGQAVMLARRSGNLEVLGNAYRNQGLLYQALGKEKEALSCLDQALKTAGEGAPALTHSRNAAAFLKVLLAQGNLLEAEQYLEESKSAGASGFYAHLHLAPARIAIARGEMGAARTELDRLYAKADQEGWVYGKIEILCLQSLTASRIEDAVTYLADALLMAEAEGFVRVFLDKGAKLIPILHLAASQNVKPEYVRSLLAGFEVDLEGERTPKQDTHQDIDQSGDFFSDRELTVLKLLAEGKTNQEISTEMIISVNTVKSHLKNIYGKLGVNSRKEAVAQARIQHLLPRNE